MSSPSWFIYSSYGLLFFNGSIICGISCDILLNGLIKPND